MCLYPWNSPPEWIKNKYLWESDNTGGFSFVDTCHEGRASDGDNWNKRLNWKYQGRQDPPGASLGLPGWLWRSRRHRLPSPAPMAKDLQERWGCFTCLTLRWGTGVPSSCYPEGFGCAPIFSPISWSWIAPLSTKKNQPHSQGTKSSSPFASLSLGMLSTALWMQRFQPKDCLSLHLSQPRAPRFTNKGLMNHNSCSYVFLLLLWNVTINLYCRVTASRWIL